MKTEAFKNLIKSAVREVIKDELKDILLEVMKTTTSTSLNLHESPQKIQPTTQPSPEELRRRYHEVLGETSKSFTTNDINPFTPSPSHDIINGNLGSGEVGMDQILNLLNTK
jgi:hypothetical protein